MKNEKKSISEFRFSKVARWTNNFTPPNISYSNSEKEKKEEVVEFIKKGEFEV